MAKDFHKDLRKLSAEDVARVFVKATGLISTVAVKDEAARLVDVYDAANEEEQRRMKAHLVRELLRCVRTDRIQENPSDRQPGPRGA